VITLLNDQDLIKIETMIKIYLKEISFDYEDLKKILTSNEETLKKLGFTEEEVNVPITEP
jgi:hypothetical protein